MTALAADSLNDNDVNHGGATIMVKRNAVAQAEKIRRVKVGDHDAISRAAHQARVPICGKGFPTDGSLACTRAAGHNEGTYRTSGSDHVCAGTDWTAVAVWL